MPDQQRQGRVRDQQAGAGPGEEQQTDFGRELAGQAERTCSEGRAHQELSPPTHGAADEQADHVAARHEQRQTRAEYRGRQGPLQSVAPETVQGTHADAGRPIGFRVRPLQIECDDFHLGPGRVEIDAAGQAPDRPEAACAAVAARRAIEIVLE